LASRFPRNSPTNHALPRPSPRTRTAGPVHQGTFPTHSLHQQGQRSSSKKLGPARSSPAQRARPCRRPGSFRVVRIPEHGRSHDRGRVLRGPEAGRAWDQGPSTWVPQAEVNGRVQAARGEGVRRKSCPDAGFGGLLGTASKSIELKGARRQASQDRPGPSARLRETGIRVAPGRAFSGAIARAAAGPRFRDRPQGAGPRHQPAAQGPARTSRAPPAAEKPAARAPGLLRGAFPCPGGTGRETWNRPGATGQREPSAFLDLGRRRPGPSGKVGGFGELRFPGDG